MKNRKRFMENAIYGIFLILGLVSVGCVLLITVYLVISGIPDGASLFAAIIVRAIMILPSIIKVSLTALEAVPKEYEDASLALGATPIETYFRVSVPHDRRGERDVLCG